MKKIGLSTSNKENDKLISHRKIQFRDTLTLVESFIFSLTLIGFSSGIKILNPTNTDWLQVGDGTMEIAWEFFRDQPVFQFPLGLNPRYGLEISSTMAFDGQIPLFSLLFHPFETFLPDRFQYIGIYLLICFILNYYTSKLIFRHLGLNLLNSGLASIILSTSPIILNRYIENTHYSLTSSFLLFTTILLILRVDLNFFKWLFLYIFAILIFLYYIPFILLAHLFLLAKSFKNKRIKFSQLLIELFLIFGASIGSMYLIGFFYGGVSSSDVGYGLFKSSLTSFIDPSGWSQIIPDLPETYGAYEGFAYVGVPSIILTLLYISLLGKPKRINRNLSESFKILWITSIFLYLFSLSNKISFGSLELFEYQLPAQFTFLTSTFRSTGRFSWLIVYVIFIWLVFTMSEKLTSKNMSILLLILTLIHILDISQQLISQRDLKFSKSYVSDLQNPAWTELRNCYEKIRIYPPSMAPDNYYNFVNLALEQDLSINTGRFGRGNIDLINKSYEKMHEDFQLSTLESDSFYIFTTATYVNPDITNYHKSQAIFSLNDRSGWGELDGYTFLAPNILNCEKVDEIKENLKGIGSDIKNRYQGETLKFGLSQDSSKYRLERFSPLQQWGVWSVGESSSIILNLKNDFKPSRLVITGKSDSSEVNFFDFDINGTYAGQCPLGGTLSNCEINLGNFEFKNSILKINVKPKKTFLRNNLDSTNMEFAVGLGITSLKLI